MSLNNHIINLLFRDEVQTYYDNNTEKTQHWDYSIGFCFAAGNIQFKFQRKGHDCR